MVLDARSNARRITSSTAERTAARIAEAHARRTSERNPRTDGRNGLTKNDSPYAAVSRNASRAGGQTGFPRHVQEFLAKEARTAVVRTGEREPISDLLRTLIYQRDRWTCQKCGRKPWAKDPNRRSGPLHLDHIIPWSAGGPDASFNLRTLCGPCNEERSNWVSENDKFATPIARICAPCLAGVSDRIARYCETADQADRFDVYCASRHHDSWALPGWSLM